MCVILHFKDGYIDWYLDDSVIRNRTGSWYFGVVSIKGNTDKIVDEKTCAENEITKADLDDNFQTSTYLFVSYTGGSYFFNTSSEEWDGVGLDTLNTTKELTGFTSNHLTSFGTGFAPQANNIDFKFIFAHPSFSDNMTIFVSIIRNSLFSIALRQTDILQLLIFFHFSLMFLKFSYSEKAIFLKLNFKFNCDGFGSFSSYWEKLP